MSTELEKVVNPAGELSQLSAGTQDDIHTILSLREQVNRISKQLGHNVPKIDLLENAESYRLIIELPGVSQANLEIAVQGREVTIAALRESFEPESQSTFTMLKNERNTGLMQRTISFPHEIDRENANAHLREGLLILQLPKQLPS